jgi:1-acyl-sn-glycerol-3-phosphate acyltransferase
MAQPATAEASSSIGAHAASFDETWISRWGRRALTVPLYTALFLLLLVAFPILVPIAALVDLVRGGPWVVLRCLSFFLWYLACEVAGIGVSLLVWLASPIYGGTASAKYREWNFRLQCWWARTLLAGAQRIFGFTFDLDIPKDIGHGPMLLFVRHSSVGDTLLPAVFLSNRFGLMLRYVLKRELLWDPCLDIVGHRLPNYFARRGSGDSQREIRAVQSLLDRLGANDGVLIYPEGTRFTFAKRARALERIAAAGDRELLKAAQRFRRVLPPRLGGPIGLLERNPGADAVFCAHTGFEAAGTFADLLRGSLVRARIRVAFWRVPFAEIPRQRDAQITWLLEQWHRVDDWVEENRIVR